MRGAIKFEDWRGIGGDTYIGVSFFGKEARRTPCALPLAEVLC